VDYVSNPLFPGKKKPPTFSFRGHGVGGKKATGCLLVKGPVNRCTISKVILRGRFAFRLDPQRIRFAIPNLGRREPVKMELLQTPIFDGSRKREFAS